MKIPVERAPKVATGTADPQPPSLRLLRVLVPALGWVLARLHTARMTALLVLDEARYRVEQDSLDQHFATIPRDTASGGAIPQLPKLQHTQDGRVMLLSSGYRLDPNWERLDGADHDDVVRHLIALGKPHAPLFAPHPAGNGASLDEMAEDVDPRRVDAAMRYLHGQFVEIVRKTS